jgi:tRNA(fMet)-specific endonuclease VapC
LPLTDAIVMRAATIYANLHQRGVLIGDADILIATTGLEHGLLVVTNNENHYQRIAGIQLENWLV